MKRSNRQMNSDGVTLIEVMIATLVLLIGVSTSLVAITTATKRAASADNKMVSIQQAREVVERIRSKEVSFNANYMREGSYSDSRFGARYSVEEHSATDDLKIIRVFVPWVEYVSGNTLTTEVVTVISKARKASSS